MMALKIKTQTIFSTYLTLQGISADELVEKTSLESCISYDENENVISHSQYLISGKLDSSIEKKYDEKGNLIMELNFTSGNDIPEKRTYRYDQNNKLIAEYLHYLDNSFDTTHYEYDENNVLLSKKTMDEDNRLEMLVEYKYDNGLLNEIITSDDSGNIKAKEIYKRDSNGYTVEKMTIEPDGAGDIITNYFDSSGHMLRSARKNDKETFENTFKYSSSGRLIEELHYSGRKLTKKMIFKYDENNLLEEITESFFVPGFSMEQKTVKKAEYVFY